VCVTMSATDMVGKVFDVRTNLRKTRLCNKYPRGLCRLGANCNFAHSESDLAHTPNLAKTKLCHDFFRGVCVDTECKFAHGYDDLRSTEGTFKTDLCHGWARGKCRFGKLCRFAHGEHELRHELSPVTPSTYAEPMSSANWVEEPLATTSGSCYVPMCFVWIPVPTKPTDGLLGTAQMLSVLKATESASDEGGDLETASGGSSAELSSESEEAN